MEDVCIRFPLRSLILTRDDVKRIFDMLQTDTIKLSCYIDDEVIEFQSYKKEMKWWTTFAAIALIWINRLMWSSVWRIAKVGNNVPRLKRCRSNIHLFRAWARRTWNRMLRTFNCKQIDIISSTFDELQWFIEDICDFLDVLLHGRRGFGSYKRRFKEARKYLLCAAEHWRTVCKKEMK